MKSNKMLYVAIGVTIFSVILTVAILMLSLNGKSGSVKMTNGMNDVARGYVQFINTGEYNKAYEKLSAITRGYVQEQSFSDLMGVIMDEKDARMEIDETKEVKKEKLKIGDKDIECTVVPVNRMYSNSVDGNITNIKEELVVRLIEEGEGYKVYIPEEEYYDYITVYVIGKANECAVEALRNKNTEKIVTENAEKIDKYLGFAQVVPSSYKNYSEVVLQIDLITAYKLLSQGEQQSAIEKVKASYARAETTEQKVRVYNVESQIYYSIGQYDEAVEVLKEALEIDPNNKSIKESYRNINSIMLGQIEASLNRGWSQVESAIKQDEKEMDRILSDIALAEAETAISMKKDAPDGYYLKGNIEYCLGDYSTAIQSLEKAVELSQVEDSEFKTKAAEILGMARVAQASNEKERDISSYQRIFNKDLRSLLFRGSEVSGIVDAIQ